MKGVLVLALVLAALGCQKKSDGESLGTIRLGARVDPVFDQAWRALAARGDEEADVFYIEDDRGEGLMARVRRGPKSVPATPPPPSTAPPPAGDPDQPSGEAVAATVRSNLPGIKACYLRLTRQGKTMAGRAILSFTVEKDGRAGNVKVDSPVFAESELPRCMSQQVASWSFPRSKRGGFEVSYPFVFVGE
jgi:hypothetical protein